MGKGKTFCLLLQHRKWYFTS